jgi:pyruvate/2-oxoglutarate dehydrogenase complex dihydrolipoamide dehydrogenase (E3) component
VEVRLKDGGTEAVEARAIVVAAGSVPVIPPIEGLAETGFWTNRDATSTRELPPSLVVLGGGPVGVELAQAFARFGTRVTVVESSDRILARDHPKSSETVAASLEADGIDVRTGVRAERAERGGAGRQVHLSDGSVVEGAELLVATGRRPADLRALGLESAGVVLDEHGVAAPDDTLRIGDGVWIAGDAAGGLQFTHVADYEGRVAMRAALGQQARADLTSIPRTTFTDPETGAVGLTVEEAREQGIDAFERSQDFAKSSRGFTIEGSSGHLTAVVDRGHGVLCGVFAAGPAASEFIGEAVLAIKQRIPLAVLADTIRAFPTGARALGGVFGEAADELGTTG